MIAEDGAYALRYAFRTDSRKGEHFHGYGPDCHDDWPIDYFTWVVVRDGVPYVFDTGFTAQEAERRGARTHLGSPIEMLATLGFEPHDVPVVVLSHLHYDHTGHLAEYPDARIVVQAAELEFWESPLSRRGAYAHLRPDADLRALRDLHERGRVQAIEGDLEIVPGLSVHFVGGHTAGTQVVRAETPDGVVVLASDASHFYANLEDDRPYGTVHHLERMYLAFDTLRALAGDEGVVVPGHDPRVVERHEALADDARIIRLRPHRATQREDQR